MGDVRIILAISNSLLRQGTDTTTGNDGNHLHTVPSTTNNNNINNNINNNAADNKVFHTTSRTLSADSTLRDLCDNIILPLLVLPPKNIQTKNFESKSSVAPLPTAASSSEASAAAEVATTTTTTTEEEEEAKSNILCLPSNLVVYDTTIHPTKEITNQFRTYHARVGTNSKTLHSMDWYPSGTIYIFDCNDILAKEEVMRGGRSYKLEEFGYNRPTTNAIVNEERAEEGLLPGKKKKKRVELSSDLLGAAGGSAGGGGSAPKPSEVLKSITDRPTHEPTTTTTTGVAKRRRRRTEQERTDRIDSILRTLDDGSKKNKKVTNQVRTMLIKSRALGNKKLRMEDRFHVETVIWNDSNGDGGDGGDDDDTEKEKKSSRNGGTREAAAASEYRYYSRVSTIGRIASSIIKTESIHQIAEVLISIPRRLRRTKSKGGGQEGKEEEEERRHFYRRLPNTMTLHEAEMNGYITEFDRLVIRVYNNNTNIGNDNSSSTTEQRLKGEEDVVVLGNATRSVLDDDESDDDDGDDQEEGGGADADGEEDDVADGGGTFTTKQATTRHETTTTTTLYQKIEGAIQTMDEKGNNYNNKTKRRKKKLSGKVREMQIKSRALGDKRRVKEEVDRFYLEVITVKIVKKDTTADEASITSNDCNIMECIGSSYIFVSRKDTVDRIISTVGVASVTPTSQKEKKDQSVEMLVRREEDDGGKDKESSGAIVGMYTYHKLQKDQILDDEDLVPFDQVVVVVL